MDNRTYFHLAAFRGSVLTATSNTAIAGVPDQILPRAASGAFLAPKQSRIWGAVSGGVNHSRARINTPATRKIALPQIAPTGTGVATTNPQNLSVYGPNGPMPEDADEISVEATHSDAGTQVQWALMWLQMGFKPPGIGEKIRIRFTAAITAVVGSWASGSMVLDQTLPSGQYQIQGMDIFGTNLLGARLIFPGGGWRPGVLGHNSLSTMPRPEFTDGSLGVYGEFDNVNFPQLEVYAEAANSAQEGALDLIRLGTR